MITPPKNFIVARVISKHITVKGKSSISASSPPTMRYVPVTWPNIFNDWRTETFFIIEMNFNYFEIRVVNERFAKSDSFCRIF